MLVGQSLDRRSLHAGPSAALEPAFSTGRASYLCSPRALLRDPTATGATGPTAPCVFGPSPAGCVPPLCAAPSPGSELWSSWEAGRGAGTSSGERKCSLLRACAARSQTTPRETIAGAAGDSREAISREPGALHSDALWSDLPASAGHAAAAHQPQPRLQRRTLRAPARGGADQQL